jgi:hypothetical protein
VVEYCFNSGLPIFGVFSVSTPLIMVFETVRHDPQCALETAWDGGGGHIANDSE